MAVLLGLVIGELVEIGATVPTEAIADLAGETVAEVCGEVVSSEGQSILTEATKVTAKAVVNTGAKYTKRKISEATDTVDTDNSKQLKQVKYTSEPVLKKMREYVLQ